MTERIWKVLDKLKYLFKNMSFLAVSQLGIKLLNFFFVPLYTSVLTTEEYGTYDLFNTTVALLIPFLTWNIRESTLRYSLGEEYDTKQVFSVSVFFGIKSILYAAVLLAGNSLFQLSPVMDAYKWLVLLMFLSQALNGIVTNFIRGLERLKDIAVSGAICSMIIIILNIVTLLPLQMGLTGYFIANISGPLIQSIYLFVLCRGWRYVDLMHIDRKLKKEMRSYCAPMIANSTAWWINGVSDRYIIVWLCGAAANGVYSVASKIPSILDVFQSIFSQAWTLTAVKEFDPEDKSGFFSKMYGMYNMCMTVMCSGLIAVSRLMARVLYAKDFFAAWRYVPFLMIAVLFGALAGYAGAIFAAAKDSRMYAYSTITGAIVNIVLNILLVKPLGPLGAAIATAVCYAVIYWARISTARKHIRLRLNLKRDFAVYLMLYAQSIVFLVYPAERLALYMIQGGLFLTACFCFRDEFKELAYKVISMARRGTRENHPGSEERDIDV